MIIKAATLFKKKKIKVVKLKTPNLKTGQVLVKIKYTSICHTQFQEINGLRGKDKYLPHCLGHEATGTIVEIGSEVKKVKVKDKVLLSWIKSDGLDAYGVKYNFKNKIVNGGPVNTFSNYSIVSENRVIKLPKKSNLKKDLLMGCAIPTAFNAVFNTLKNAKKDNILIIGAGGLGIASTFAAKKFNFKKIYVLDKISSKLTLSKQFGATNTILVKNNKHLNLFLKKYRNFFFNILECTGNASLLEKSINLVSNFGGKLIIIGNYPNKKKITINPWHFIFGKSISGSWQDPISYKGLFKIFYKQFKDFKYKKFFGKKVYTLDNINKAIDDFASGKVLRPLIKL